MEKIVEQGLLYDFYGELLTPHQKQIYEAIVYQDMSLGEIAQNMQISRQGVFDLVRRCDKILVSYEERLHLIEKFSKVKDTVQRIEAISTQKEIKDLANQILEEL